MYKQKQPLVTPRNLSYLLVTFFLLIPPTFSQTSSPETYDQLLSAIRQVRQASINRLSDAARQEKVRVAWETGRLIDEHILKHQDRAEFGKFIIEHLARDLDTSKTELYFMLEFARRYPEMPVSKVLSWSHYRELLSLSDDKEIRTFTEKIEKENWSYEKFRAELRLAHHPRIAGEPLPVTQPGILGLYQVVEKNGAKYLDLGFSTYSALSPKDSEKFKEGDYVSAGPEGLTPEKKYTGETWHEIRRPYFKLHTYHAQLLKVYDGDTFHALVDLGFGIVQEHRIRLRRVDAPELPSVEGQTSKAALEKILAREHGRIILQSHEMDQHGRPLADVYLESHSRKSGNPEYVNIDQELLDQGLAVAL